MTHGSLFSGIGGFDLAAEWMGWGNVFHCEWNPFGQKVLKHYWPNSISYNDITKTDFSIHRGTIDILTGGFPCQPYSTAGKRLGKEDDRHLWPEMLRAIREIQPSWVVGENVRGLVSWNGGMVFDEVQSDLEAQGYEILPFLLPACAVNAPHRRDRIWFIAYNQHNGNRRREQQPQSEQKTDRAFENTGCNGCSNGKYDKQISKRNEWEFSTRGKERLFTCEALQNDTNTDCNGCDQCDCNNEVNTSEGGKYALSNAEQSNVNGNIADTEGKSSWGELQQRQTKGKSGGCDSKNGDASDTDLQRYDKFKFTAITNKPLRFNSQKNIIGEPGGWQNFPTQSPICSRNDGLSTRLDGITFSKWRNESIKAGGNAIVPQVVLQIFKAIEQYECKAKP